MTPQEFDILQRRLAAQDPAQMQQGLGALNRGRLGFGDIINNVQWSAPGGGQYGGGQGFNLLAPFQLAANLFSPSRREELRKQKMLQGQTLDLTNVTTGNQLKTARDVALALANTQGLGASSVVHPFEEGKLRIENLKNEGTYAGNRERRAGELHGQAMLLSPIQKRLLSTQADAAQFNLENMPEAFALQNATGWENLGHTRAGTEHLEAQTAAQRMKNVFLPQELLEASRQDPVAMKLLEMAPMLYYDRDLLKSVMQGASASRNPTISKIGKAYITQMLGPSGVLVPKSDPSEQAARDAALVKHLRETGIANTSEVPQQSPSFLGGEPQTNESLKNFSEQTAHPGVIDTQTPQFRGLISPNANPLTDRNLSVLPPSDNQLETQPAHRGGSLDQLIRWMLSSPQLRELAKAWLIGQRAVNQPGILFTE